MTQAIPLRCRCGTVRGITRPLSAREITRAVCYCDDCQTYARFLGRSDLLDAGGGTEIFHMAPGHLQLTDGLDQVRCARLSDRGPYRWYAGCRRSAIANTPPVRMPAAGVVHSFIDLDEAGRQRTFGPPRGLMARFATGPTVPGAHPKMPISLMLKALALMLRWQLSGRSKPSPFYDRAGEPIAVPEVLDQRERQRLHPTR